MAKLDIYGGLLGAGKTTLIRAMLRCAYRGKRVAVIENEIGRVNLDAGAFSGVTVRPLTAGCVCCTLKGDLVTAVRELLQGVAPDYIVMEASGAADLETLAETLEIDLPVDEEFDTLGGLIFSRLTEIPADGQHPVVECFGLRISVEEIADRRVEWAIVEKLAKPENEEN